MKKGRKAFLKWPGRAWLYIGAVRAFSCHAYSFKTKKGTALKGGHIKCLK